MLESGRVQRQIALQRGKLNCKPQCVTSCVMGTIIRPAGDAACCIFHTAFAGTGSGSRFPQGTRCGIGVQTIAFSCAEMDLKHIATTSREEKSFD